MLSLQKTGMIFIKESAEELRKTVSQKEFRLLLLIIFSGLLVRLAFYLYFTTDGRADFFEYGEIARNILSGNGYSLFWFSGEGLEHTSAEGVTPFPSAYMAPAFSFIILPLFLTQNALVTHIGFILVQSILYFLITYLLLKLTINQGGKALIAAVAVYAVNPEFIAAFKSPTPVLIYHLLILLFLYLGAGSTDSLKKIVIFGIAAGTGLLLRFEFLIIAVFVPVSLAVIKRNKSYLLVPLIALCMLTPWIARNYAVFGEPLLSTSTGLNLYRGNNPYETGTWADEKIDSLIKSLPRDEKFEIHFNAMYMSEAVNYIDGDLPGFFMKMPEKISGLFFVSTGSRAGDLVHNIISALLLIFFLLYLIKTKGNIEAKTLMTVILLSTIAVSAVFFSIPRYGTMMRIIFVPFVWEGVFFIVNKIKK